ncbi:replication protein A 70 kDa DNA-binding subunit C-like [Helianthus annuus]|uniref:replication protein A 70 kDa DNA-binding subunit C-like n=1 Tax=Helianthus annuus TaxID=4232 RepID=UPI000B8F1C9D|nr:replication protein A 70 kDa DNA-binding subunit C-like [Helianthus annuus]
MSNYSCSYIHQISTEKDTWKLKVRVLRLWKQAYQIDMILMDENGDKIQATVKKGLMCVFENQLEEGSVVLLSKFGVGEMNDKFPIINREVEVELTVDVICYVVSTTDIEVFNRSGKESKRISFEIVNFTGDTIGCTLWDNFSQQFSTFIQGYSCDAVVIVLIQFAKVKNWRGSPNIQNAFFGSRLFINDDIEEITSFRNRLIEGGQVEGSSQITPASLSSQTVYSSGEEFLKKYERKFVEEIWDVAVESVFVVLGTIRFVEEDFGWFYVGCSKCSKKVIPASDHAGGLDDIDADDAASDDGFYYNFCNSKYKIRVRVQDATGTISFVIFDKDVSKVIGRSAHDIHDQQLRDGEENVCPREVKQLVSKRYIFKIEISTFNLTSNYHVNTVLKLCDDNEIIKVMLQDDTAEQEAFSFTEDSEVPTDAANDDATSPQAAKRSSDVSKDENGESSTTKRRLLNVKLEK